MSQNVTVGGEGIPAKLPALTHQRAELIYLISLPTCMGLRNVSSNGVHVRITMATVSAQRRVIIRQITYTPEYV